MIQTKITEMFGVKYPIICGAMMWLCKPELCAAISNAGGLGDLTAANYETEEDFRKAIEEVRKLTDKPFMVSVTILPSVRITPDHYKVDRETCEITYEYIPTKKIMFSRRFQPSEGRGGVEVLPVPEDRANARVLTDEHLRQLVQLGNLIETHFGCPQDIEWGIEGDTVYLLQSRPITSL